MSTTVSLQDSVSLVEILIFCKLISCRTSPHKCKLIWESEENHADFSYVESCSSVWISCMSIVIPLVSKVISISTCERQKHPQENKDIFFFLHSLHLLLEMLFTSTLLNKFTSYYYILYPLNNPKVSSDAHLLWLLQYVCL